MNYEFIEYIVRNNKQTDSKESKEDLVNEFLPLINSICKRTFISGYDIADLQNECIVTLLECISKYNVNSHRFVGYAGNSIKNTLNLLIRVSATRQKYSCLSDFSLSSTINDISSDEASLDEIIILNNDNKLIQMAIEKLNTEEKFLFNYLFINENTLYDYSCIKHFSYTTAKKKKKQLLNKLRKNISI